MKRILPAIGLVLLVIYVVPFAVYGAASILGALPPPDVESPAGFLLGVLITKFGTAIVFVAIFAANRTLWSSRWLLYAALWFLMFVFSEVGETVSGRTTEPEAVLGIVSEAIYSPVSALIARWFLRERGR